MSKRHCSLPPLWLMTDERLGSALFATLAALPAGSGVIFRHYATPKAERRALFNHVRAIARKKRLVLVLAGSPGQARAWGAQGSHGRHPGAMTAPVHNLVEMRAAERRGAQLLFLSPLFATRSHPGGRGLGRVRFAALCHQARRPVIALGGMTDARFRRLPKAGNRSYCHGWAAIDGLTVTAVAAGRDQKRNAVPR